MIAYKRGHAASFDTRQEAAATKNRLDIDDDYRIVYEPPAEERNYYEHL